MSDIAKIATGIVTVGLIATLVVNGANTAKVVSSVTTGFTQSLSAAEKG